MNGAERRECIRKDLKKSLKAIKGAELAKEYDVSRQVIVQDIALLRAVGEQIISTADGYLYFSFHMNLPKRVFAVKHEEERIREEMEAIIEHEGNILNVFIHHPIYGDLVADLLIENERQMEEFLKKNSADDSKPLMLLTDNFHYHTIEAPSEEHLDRIEKSLDALGFLMHA